MYHDKDIARLRHRLKTSASIIVTHEKLARHGESRIPQHSTGMSPIAEGRRG